MTCTNFYNPNSDRKTNFYNQNEGGGRMSEYIMQVNYDTFHGTFSHKKREEIVRCRDCKRFHANTNGLDCPKLDPDGFCAWGERKNDE